MKRLIAVKKVTRFCNRYDQEINIQVGDDSEYIVEIYCNGVLIKRMFRYPVEKKWIKNGKEYRYKYIRIHLPRCTVIEKALYGEFLANQQFYDLEIRVYRSVGKSI